MSTASPETLLEVILGRCRDETNRFVALRNRTRNRTRKDLEKAVLQAKNNFFSHSTELNGTKLDAAKTDLDVFLDSEEKSRQQHVRAKWITSGDRPSAWYINLAKSRAASNSIPMLTVPKKNDNGEPVVGQDGKLVYIEIRDQTEIRNEVGAQYAQIFRAKKVEM